jgi:cation diffusion facilitator family transporter
MKKKIVDFIIKKYKLESKNDHKKFGYFEGILSIILNFIIFLIKYFLSLSLNSISLKADAFHTLSDILTSLIIIISFYFSSKKADKKHPFGHGRIEKLFAIFMSIILIYVGYEFLISSINRLKNPLKIDANFFTVFILFLTILMKEFLTLLSLEFSKITKSSSLKADAWHHRSDSLATLLIIFGLFTFKYGLFFFDGIFGIVVSSLIIYTGISIIFESGSYLLGEEPSKDLIDKIKEITNKFDFIEDIHHIHIHDYGNQLEITFHVRLKGEKTLKEVHEKISIIEKEIEKEIENSNVTIHAEPI